MRTKEHTRLSRILGGDGGINRVGERWYRPPLLAATNLHHNLKLTNELTSLPTKTKEQINEMINEKTTAL